MIDFQNLRSIEKQDLVDANIGKKYYRSCFFSINPKSSKEEMKKLYTYFFKIEDCVRSGVGLYLHGKSLSGKTTICTSLMKICMCSGLSAYYISEYDIPRYTKLEHLIDLCKPHVLCIDDVYGKQKEFIEKVVTKRCNALKTTYIINAGGLDSISDRTWDLVENHFIKINTTRFEWLC